MLEYMKDRYRYIKNQCLGNDIDNVIWIVDRIPKLVGFSLEKDKVRHFTPFWIVHYSLLFYIYIWGTAHYQIYHAEEITEFIQSYMNISVLVFILDNSWWWRNQRPLLKSLLTKVKWSDDMVKRNVTLHEKHIKWIKIIKFLTGGFLGFNILQSAFIYLPARLNTENDFCMTNCIGMDLTYSPNKEICSVIILIHNLCVIIICLSFQALLGILIVHATAIYHLLAEEILQLDRDDDLERIQVKEKLSHVIKRHIVIVDVTKDIKYLYSIPIGTNLGSNAICICMFFYLDLKELFGITPLLVYCFLVFFLYCFLCQNLVNAAELFERSVYSCGWEKFDVKEQKAVYLMLLQAQQKFEILAADIVPVNIYTFATTCQFMFKLVTVIKF
ncbi:odorant receptor 49a-like [Hyposmocoma kahamanoa]|uniref:odorant receptor 49a-like n=1 Tax=Hyposmocoma kahamanoa TaxID=1477025 RepID=UPI000E6D9F49|nr:odorant receptor 49a-like [Hyposmocoma kahamanoa]